jgi:adenylate kinase
VVHLVVDYDRIVARLSGRRQCPVCGTLYSLKTNPPKVSGICDLDGAKLVTREDDREEVIRERLQEYDSQTLPILRFFREAGVSTIEVGAAEAAPEQIVENVLAELTEAGVIAGDGSHPDAARTVK